MNYVLYGEEHYLLEESLKRIVREHVSKEDELNTVTYDASRTDVSVVLDDARTIPFFCERKVIIVNHATFLSTNDDTQWDVDAVESYLKDPMESTVLIFVGDFVKLDGRKKIVKFIQKTCRVLQYAKLDESSKISYIRQEIEKRNLPVSSEALQELEKRLPCDIQTIKNEFDKLSLYERDIDLEAVEHLVTRPLEEDVFLLVNAVVNRDLKQAMHLWNDLCVLNKDAIYMIALLASQFRFLYQVKTLMIQGCNKSDITSELKAHPYRVQLSMQNCTSLELSYILELLARLAELDRKLKSGQLDKKLGFELFLMQLKKGKIS